MNLKQFGQTIKQKHPSYSDMDDEILGKKMLAKYPQYMDMVEHSPEKTDTRLGSAKESFIGSFGRAKEKIGRAYKLGKTSGGLFTPSGSRSALAALGAAGEVVTSPLAALTGLAEPEITKGVEYVAKKIPESVKAKAQEILENVPEEVKQTIGDAFSATGLLAVAPVKSAAQGSFRKLLSKTGQKLETSAEKSILKSKDKFLDKLVRPAETKAVREAEVPRTTEAGKGIFARSKVELAPNEATAKKYLEQIPELKPGMSDQQSYNVIVKSNLKEAKTLEKAIKSNDFIYPKQELMSTLNKAKIALSESPTLVGDAQKTAQKLIDKFQKIVNEKPAKGSNLLQARKDYDLWVKSQKPKAFDSKTEGAFEIANREIRKTVNEFLDTKATNVSVKKSLVKQKSLYDAMDIIKPKAAIEANTGIGRMVQNMAKIVGIKNKLVQEMATLIGIGGLGAAAAFAPTAAKVIGTGIVVNAAGKLVLSPKLRNLLGKSLIELSKKTSLNTLGIGVAEVNKLKNEIQDILDEYEPSD